LALPRGAGSGFSFQVRWPMRPYGLSIAIPNANEYYRGNKLQMLKVLLFCKTQICERCDVFVETTPSWFI